MTHDPLCPMRPSPGFDNRVFPELPKACYCTLISKVRVDERDEAVGRMNAFINTKNFPVGVVSATEWAVHAVKATPIDELPERLRAMLDD